MAFALTALQRIASAQETTAGVALAAVRLVPHLTGSSFTEQEERQKLEEARGVLAAVDDVLTRRSSMLELQQEFDFDHCLLALLCGVQNIAGVPLAGAAPYTYAISANPVAPRAKASATFEVLQSDGVTDHVLRQFSHARPTQIAIEFAVGNTSKLNTTWMGGAAATVAKAAIAATTLASRRVQPTSLWDVAIDDTWATLGTTKATNVRALTWTLATGVAPSYHLTGRNDLDLDGWYDGRLDLALSLTLDINAAAAAEIAHWRAGDLRFVRLTASNGAAAAALRSIQIDQAIRITGSPNLLASDGEQAVVTLEGTLRSDAAGAADDFLAIDLKNGITSWNP